MKTSDHSSSEIESSKCPLKKHSEWKSLCQPTDSQVHIAAFNKKFVKTNSVEWSLSNESHDTSLLFAHRCLTSFRFLTNKRRPHSLQNPSPSQEILFCQQEMIISWQFFLLCPLFVFWALAEMFPQQIFTVLAMMHPSAFHYPLRQSNTTAQLSLSIHLSSGLVPKRIWKVERRISFGGNQMHPATCFFYFEGPKYQEEEQKNKPCMQMTSGGRNVVHTCTRARRHDFSICVLMNQGLALLDLCSTECA